MSVTRHLVRAADLAGFRRALVRLAREGPPLAARRRVIILPTRASIEVFRQTLERAAARAGDAAFLVADLVTRDEWMARLHLALADAPRLLTRVEREVMLGEAGRRAAARAGMGGAPFHLRPGLTAAMLDFYDELRRRQRGVGRFTRALFDELRVERGTDRGSEGLIHQTAFLGFAFLGYERRVAASGALDEHALRDRLLADPPALSIDHVVVAVADHPTDPRGLWPSDFDLLGRLPGLRIDVVMTDETHDAGFRDRLERELPGIEEAREPGAPWNPQIVRPASERDAGWCFVSHDREEELRDVARAIRGRGEPAPTAIVFQRPLPYLYLAGHVLTDAGVPFQTFDALPLASQPYAALLDLVLVVARTGGTRESTTALLRSPLLRVSVDGVDIDPRDASALDAVLAARRTTGGADRYVDEVDEFFNGRDVRDRIEAARARRAARAAQAIAASLSTFQAADSGAAQVRTIAAFLRRHQHGPDEGEVWRESYLRARAAVLGALDGLAEAMSRHDDRPRAEEEVTAAIHHAIEALTFSSRRGRTGVHLADTVAARFGEFDHVHLVGLVETEWPERLRRSIFYTTGLLKSLGWPQDADATAVQHAAFRDLAGLPARTLHLHAFKLEADALVGLSPMIEAVRGLPSTTGTIPAKRRVFADEILTAASVPGASLAPGEAAWLALRRERPPLDDRRYGGFVVPPAPQAYRVSKVDRFVDCPFKYFAESVLMLPEDREETSGLSPLERGTLLHDLFERFYRAWQDEGRGTITAALLPEAVETFGRMARDAFAELPDADRALEETRLLGSIVARGVAERVFELEAESGGQIVHRFLEEKLRGPFVFPRLGGLASRSIEISGKADRIDLFHDGGLRVVDYKLGRLPDARTSVQIATYALAAQQQLEARDGQTHPITAAMYIAFGDEQRLEGRLGGKGAAEVEAAVRARAEDFARVVGEIEAGEFPPRPKKTSECAWCGYAGVCRKEYRMEDDAAEPV